MQEIRMDRFTQLLMMPNVMAINDPVTQPIYQSSIFRMPDHRVAARTEGEVHPTAYYTRWGNPTVAYLENQLSVLMGCNASLVFPTGMAAIMTTLFALVAPGDLVAVARDLYGDTTRFFLEELPRLGVRVELFDAALPHALEGLVRRGARLVYFESVSNPALRVADLDAIRAACGSHDVVTVCDCTFSPPGVLCAGARPADLVIHSLTKYMSGHYAVFGGSVSGWQALIDRIWHKQSLYGSAIDPQAAWQISQGIKTLELRIARQNATALQLAQRLASHPEVQAVHYPITDTRPGGGDTVRRYFIGGGGVVSIALKGGVAAATRLVERTKVFGLSVSIGGVVSCIEHAESMSHSMLSAMDGAVLAEAGVAGPPANLVRLSVGTEPAADLLHDLLQALDSVSAARRAHELQPTHAA
jgi:cystathionine beta-lyase/cystathionine gamma-synthase